MSVFCLHRFALSTNPRIIPAEISRYRLLSMSVSLISRQPMKLQISFGFARAMPTTNPRTGMLWERDWLELESYPALASLYRLWSGIPITRNLMKNYTAFWIRRVRTPKNNAKRRYFTLIFVLICCAKQY